jgi:hypothetical protein
MIKSFSRLTNVPPGFEASNVLTGQISLTRAEYDKPEQCVVYVNQTLARLKAIPGVETAAFVAPMPLVVAMSDRIFELKVNRRLHRVVNPRQVIEVLHPSTSLR